MIQAKRVWRRTGPHESDTEGNKDGTSKQTEMDSWKVRHTEDRVCCRAPPCSAGTRHAPGAWPTSPGRDARCSCHAWDTLRATAPHPSSGGPTTSTTGAWACRTRSCRPCSVRRLRRRRRPRQSPSVAVGLSPPSGALIWAVRGSRWRRSFGRSSCGSRSSIPLFSAAGRATGSRGFGWSRASVAVCRWAGTCQVVAVVEEDRSETSTHVRRLGAAEIGSSRQPHLGMVSTYPCDGGEFMFGSGAACSPPGGGRRIRSGHGGRIST